MQELEAVDIAVRTVDWGGCFEEHMLAPQKWTRHMARSLLLLEYVSQSEDMLV